MKSIETLGAEEMASFYRTGEAHEIVGFSPIETPKRAEELNVQISALEQSVMLRVKEKYGAAGFGASVTAAQLPEFQADRKLFNDFRAWKTEWETASDSWHFRFTGEDTVNKYESELPGWKKRFDARGLVYSTSLPPVPAPPTPKTPSSAAASESKSSKGLSTTHKVLLVAGGVGVCGAAVWAFSRRGK